MLVVSSRGARDPAHLLVHPSHPGMVKMVKNGKKGKIGKNGKNGEHTFHIWFVSFLTLQNACASVNAVHRQRSTIKAIILYPIPHWSKIK